MKISKLEYVKMIASVAAGREADDFEDIAVDSGKIVDSILSINGITVSDEVSVEPIGEFAFYQICEQNHEVGDGIEGIVSELKKRGLVIA